MQTNFHDDKHGFIRSVEYVIFNQNFTLATDSTTGCGINDTWCQIMWTKMMMQAHIPAQWYNVLTQCVSPLHPLAQVVVLAKCNEQLVVLKDLSELEVWDV